MYAVGSAYASCNYCHVAETIILPKVGATARLPVCDDDGLGEILYPWENTWA